MRAFSIAFVLLIAPALASAQDTGVAINMGRGLDNGMSVGWTFRENWTLRPTVIAGYSAQTGFQGALGSTVIRSFGLGDRVYLYVGAGFYWGAMNRGNVSNLGGPSQIGNSPNGNQLNSVSGLGSANALYVAAPVGLRVRVHGNVEAFAEGAYQQTLSGTFGRNQTGQFYGTERQRAGATFGLSLRLN